MRHVGVTGGSGDIEKKRTFILEYPFHRRGPLTGPAEIFFRATLVLILGVLDAEIVRRGGDDKIDGLIDP